MARLSIVRHPKCRLNELGRFQGRSDSPLTSLGVSQMRALIERMRQEPIQVVLIGDHGRHRIIGTAIGYVTKASIRVDPRLAEVDYGDWECLTEDECSWQSPELWSKYQAASPLTDDFTFPNGSSFAEIRSRAAELLQGLDYRRDACIVSSNMTIRVILAMATGTEPPDRIPQCALTTLEGTARDNLKVVRLIDTSFLGS